MPARHVADKCKTVLTASALLLAFLGAFLPKFLAFDSLWMRIVALVATLCLMAAVILILEFFSVGQSKVLSLAVTTVDLDAENLKKHLINLNLERKDYLDNRSDYLVDVYKVTRFCFLSAFTLFVFLFSWNLYWQSPTDQAEAVVRAIRADKNLTSLLTGPSGSRGIDGRQGQRGAQGLDGAKGDKGDQGTVDEDALLHRLLRDRDLKQLIDAAIKSSESKPPPKPVRSP